MYSIKYIDKVIAKLKVVGVDFYDHGHFSDKYKRYLKKFADAKGLIALSSDVSALFPLEDPRELIYKTAKEVENLDEFLEHFSRSNINFKIEFEFDDLDKKDNHTPAK